MEVTFTVPRPSDHKLLSLHLSLSLSLSLSQRRRHIVEETSVGGWATGIHVSLEGTWLCMENVKQLFQKNVPSRVAPGLDNDWCTECTE